MAQTYVSALGWIAGCEECGAMPDEFETLLKAGEWAAEHVCGLPDSLRERMKRAYSNAISDSNRG